MLSMEKLKFLRYSHGISQGKMAKWLNVTPMYVSLMECGKYYPTKEIYNAWLNCVYGVGKPLDDTPRPNTKKGRALAKAKKEKESENQTDEIS